MPENDDIDFDDVDQPDEPLAADPAADPAADAVDDPADDDEHIDPAAPPVSDPVDQGQVSRSKGRIQRIQEERRAAEEEAARARAELAQARADLEAARRARQEQEDQNLDPDERWRRQANAQIQAMQMQSADAADRAAYMMKAQANPLYAKNAERVEKLLKEARAQGFNPERESVLYRILGQDQIARAGSAPATKRAAAERVSAARGASPGIKTNVTQGKQSASLYERLKDIPL